MSLADDARGRIIHQMIDVTLIPLQGGELGDTDPAFEIGRGLVREAMGLLKMAAEKEGFEVQVEFSQVVY